MYVIYGFQNLSRIKSGQILLECSRLLEEFEELAIGGKLSHDVGNALGVTVLVNKLRFQAVIKDFGDSVIVHATLYLYFLLDSIRNVSFVV